MDKRIKARLEAAEADLRNVPDLVAALAAAKADAERLAEALEKTANYTETALPLLPANGKAEIICRRVSQAARAALAAHEPHLTGPKRPGRAFNVGAARRALSDKAITWAHVEWQLSQACDEVDALRAEVAALREALYNHGRGKGLCRCEWCEAASSGAEGKACASRDNSAPDSPETLAGVPVEDLYKGLSYE